MAREMTRWEPFRELAPWQDVLDRWFARSAFGPAFAWMPPLFEGNLEVDMYETDGNIIVEAPISGVKPEDIDVHVTGDTLVIKGETKAEEKEEKANYLYQERRYGAFARSLQLPAGVKADKASAKFENGVLKRVFKFDDFAQALAFTNRVGEAAEEEGHHPKLVTEWGKVMVTWWTHKIGGLHRNDFIMASKTDALRKG